MMKKSKRKLLALLLVAGMTLGGINGTAFVQAEEADVDNNVAIAGGESIAIEEAAGKAVQLFEPKESVSGDSLEFSYVYFGSYPQSQVIGEALTDKIVNAEYVSSEAVVDGVRYKRMTEEDAYYSRHLAGDKYETSYKWFDWLSVDSEYLYFKYEPIKWRVIKVEDNRAILCSDMILDCRQYHEIGSTGIRLTSWLNNKEDGFTCHAFSDEELASIYSRKDFVMEDNYYQYYYENEDDKVYIPDVLEKMGKYQSSRMLKMSEYTYVQGLFKRDNNTMYGDWWLNESSGPFAEYVTAKGEFRLFDWDADKKYPGSEGLWVGMTQNVNCNSGVVPGIILDLSEESLWMTEEEYENLEKADNPITGNAVVTGLSGDVNQDNKVTLDDASEVLKCALKINAILEDNRKLLADADGVLIYN